VPPLQLTESSLVFLPLVDAVLLPGEIMQTIHDMPAICQGLQNQIITG
jgi:hypothetical protein